MRLSEKTMDELARFTTKYVIAELENRGLLRTKPYVTAFEKTKKLMEHYATLQRIVKERTVPPHGGKKRPPTVIKDKSAIDVLKETLDLSFIGVPTQKPVVDGDNVGTVDIADIVQNAPNVQDSVQGSVQTIVQVLSYIDRGIENISYVPRSEILRLYYVEGIGQERLALKYQCSQQRISKILNNLIKLLAFELFPEQSALELLE